MTEHQTPTPDLETEAKETAAEEEEWKPSAAAVSAAMQVGQIASLTAASDPVAASFLFHNAAELLDPTESFWQKVGRGLDGPLGVKLVEQLGQITQQAIIERSADANRPPLWDCMGSHRRGSVVQSPSLRDLEVSPWPPGSRRNPTPVGDQPNYGKIFEDEALRVAAQKMDGEIGAAARRQQNTGLTEEQYQHFRSRLAGHFPPDQILLITGLMYGIGKAPLDPPPVP